MLDPFRSPASRSSAPFELGGTARVDRSYQAPRGRLRLVLAQDAPLAWVTIQGVGDMPGLYALLGYLDEAAGRLAPGERVRILIDVSRVSHVPPRVPLALGRWILAHRHQLERAGVVVSGGIVQVLTRTVFRIAGVGGVRITTDAASARRWVG
jgi:hypothetical protein